MVLDTQKKLVVGVKVTLHSTPQEAVTDETVVADFQSVAAGEHQLEIAYEGYQGEEAANLTSDVEEFDLMIQIKATSPLLPPK